MAAFEELVSGMAEGRNWSLMGDGDAVRALLDRVYDERCHSARHHRDAYLRLSTTYQSETTNWRLAWGRGPVADQHRCPVA